jgi:phosphoribosylamine--glycine ligase
MMRADFDFAQACMAATRGELSTIEANWAPASSVCVVLASKGYPEKPEIGREISGLDARGRVSVPGVVFHAGVRSEGTKYYTSGGRVLGIAASGKDLSSCRRAIYALCSSVEFEGREYRTDVAALANAGVQAAAEGRNA